MYRHYLVIKRRPRIIPNNNIRTYHVEPRHPSLSFGTSLAVHE